MSLSKKSDTSWIFTVSCFMHIMVNGLAFIVLRLYITWHIPPYIHTMLALTHTGAVTKLRHSHSHIHCAYIHMTMPSGAILDMQTKKVGHQTNLPITGKPLQLLSHSHHKWLYDYGCMIPCWGQMKAKAACLRTKVWILTSRKRNDVSALQCPAN